MDRNTREIVFFQQFVQFIGTGDRLDEDHNLMENQPQPVRRKPVNVPG